MYFVQGIMQLRVRKSEEEEEACSGSDKEALGPWVGKGNLVGFLDSDDEELIEKCDGLKVLELEGKERKKVGLFLLKLTFRFLGLLDQSGFGEDRSVGEEGREQMSNAFKGVWDELEGYRCQGDDNEDRSLEKEGIIAGLKDDVN